MSAVVIMGLCSCSNKNKTAEYSQMLASDDIVISTGTTVSETKSKESNTITSMITTASTEISSETVTSTVSSVKSTTTAAMSKTKKSVTTTVRNAAVVNNKNNNSNNNSNKNNNSNNNSNKNNNSNNNITTTKNIIPTETTIITTVDTEPIAPEDVDKYVDFGSLSSGDGYSFDGSTLNIFSSGTYHLSGELNGMIYINVSNEEKVKLKLNGVGITNDGAPCIQVDNADRVIINAEDGSSNYFVCNSTNDVNDAAIFSKDDLRIKGNGSIYVSCANEHGISCNKDLEIEECQLTVEAEKTGINSHKSISIFSGNINTKGDNCGIRCRDYIEIFDGYVSSCGGKKADADRGGIISDSGNFYISGGTVIAVGMNQTVPNGQCSAVFSFPSVVAKDNIISISVNGGSVASVQPNKKFSYVLISSPDLYVGAVCDVWLSDTYYDNFTITDPITQAMLDGIQ